jgi:acyl-CoA hydrolase
MFIKHFYGGTMDVVPFVTYHLVKQDDLNHHGTLYAGRCADWFVECGFIAAASLTKPENIVCLKIHGLLFSQPARLGDILCFESKIVFTGKTSLIAHVQVIKKGKSLLIGYITFIHVDLEGKPIPHGIIISPSRSEDIQLQEEANRLRADPH